MISFYFGMITIKFNKAFLEKKITLIILINNITGSIFDPFVIKHVNIYKMCVSWRIKGAIALSTSKDGTIIL